MDWDSLDYKARETAYNECCSEVEQLALNTVCAQQMPIFYPLKFLTKGDCWLILSKYEAHFNILEKAVFLTALTDYITCAYENTHVYETFRKKSDRNSISPLLIRLQRHWHKIFSMLSKRDMTVAQLTSLIVLLRQSVERLTDRSHKLFFNETLTFAEVALMKLKTGTLKVDIKAARCVQKMKLVEKQKLKKEAKANINHITKMESSTGAGGNLNHLAQGRSNETEGNVNQVDNKKSRKEDKGNTKNIKKLKSNKRAAPEKPSKSKEIDIENKLKVGAKSKKRKFTSNIRKYILKPCENKIPAKNEESKTGKSLSKDNSVKQEDVSVTASKELNTRTPEQLPPEPTTDKKLDPPPEKKPRLDEHHLTNGKVNAFKLMMEGKKHRVEEHRLKSGKVPVNAFKHIIVGSGSKKGLTKNVKVKCK